MFVAGQSAQATTRGDPVDAIEGVEAQQRRRQDGQGKYCQDQEVHSPDPTPATQGQQGGPHPNPDHAVPSTEVARWHELHLGPAQT